MSVKASTVSVYIDSMYSSSVSKYHMRHLSTEECEEMGSGDFRIHQMYFASIPFIMLVKDKIEQHVKEFGYMTEQDWNFLQNHPLQERTKRIKDWGPNAQIVRSTHGKEPSTYCNISYSSKKQMKLLRGLSVRERDALILSP